MSFMGEGDVEESVVLEHSRADSAGEFFDLLFDVDEEDVGAPSSDEHDGVDGNASKIHHHGSTRAKRMRANFVGLEAEVSAADSCACCP